MFASLEISHLIHQPACDQWLAMFADGGSVVVNAQGRVVAAYPTRKRQALEVPLTLAEHSAPGRDGWDQASANRFATA